jgi:multidrug efflux pump subunit AcrA (membrane-fusion protein)
MVTRAEAQAAGAPLFTSAGWIEPRPTPVLVTALAEGVVDQLLVVEGDAVEPGQVIARLIEADSQLALSQAQADLRLQQAELRSAQAAHEAAKTNLKYPLSLQTEVAEADAMLAKVRTESANLPFEIQAAESRQRFAELDLAGKRNAGDGLSQRVLQRSQTEAAVAGAALEQLKVRQERLIDEVRSVQARRDALARQLELKTQETREVAQSAAAVSIAEARIQQAQVAVDTAKLKLQRMVVRAPCAGRVLNLVARPGSQVMGQDREQGDGASTVVTLYDPQMLQVRADVRLEDLPQVQPGQEVRIETAAVKEPLVGTVLFATSLADIQKNTLQVKVAIQSPPPVIKPEMLVQATFLAAPREASPDESERPTLWVPRQLADTAAEGATIWVADQAAGVARRKSVKLGRAGANDLVEVVEGLSQADKLIVAGREGLEDGGRIKIQGEDAALGVFAQHADTERR